MRYIVDAPQGEIVIKRLAENLCNPLDFLFEVESLPKELEEKLCKQVEESKRERFDYLSTIFADKEKHIGYENVEDIPEQIVFTELNLKFSDKGEGLLRSEIRRMICDDTEDVHFEVDASMPIDLSNQVEDLKRLALIFLEKIMFQKREVENYIL